MYAYFLDKGHTLDSLLSLSYIDKVLYAEAMEHSIKMEYEKHQRMFGGG